MSLHPQAGYQVPEETQRVARAAFPRGNVYMRVADLLGSLYQDQQFAALFPTRGQPPKRPCGLPWSLCCSLPKGFPTARPLTPCAAVLTGSMSWG